MRQDGRQLRAQAFKPLNHSRQRLTPQAYGAPKL
jgi:hypothetical protein